MTKEKYMYMERSWGGVDAGIEVPAIGALVAVRFDEDETKAEKGPSALQIHIRAMVEDGGDTIIDVDLETGALKVIREIVRTPEMETLDMSLKNLKTQYDAQQAYLREQADKLNFEVGN